MKDFAAYCLKYFAAFFGLISLLVIILITIFSLGDSTCSEPDEFGSKGITLSSNPGAYKISGYDQYNHQSGGQASLWYDTNFVTNGKALTLGIKGSWSPWEISNPSDSGLEALPNCRMCAKNAEINNCICDETSIDSRQQFPQTELNYDGSDAVDCAGTDQDDPDKCTCTNSGQINDNTTFIVIDSHSEKDGTDIDPNNQTECKFTAGSGLYIGLFGHSGVSQPGRFYHLYPPTDEVCNIDLNEHDQCIDEDGKDQTEYIYQSPNAKIFVKNDKGTIGTNDDEYHEAGERIKFIFNDRYYQDNYGSYQITMLGGFLEREDGSLLEDIVSTVEDAVLGEISSDGKTRTGGALEFLYNSIVKDSAFILLVQTCLILYVTIFGIYVLAGAIQISRKEIMRRLIKISLVIFFTTESSWYFYNQIVVGLFKDGMDSIIVMLMSMADQIVDSNSLVKVAQADREFSSSNATRFSFIDDIIQELISGAVSKKIFGLLIGSPLGFIYIPMIYALIFGFVAIMVMAAFAYITALLKLVFVLSLGPIFMITVLFNRTDEIFKRWLSFMAAQSLQIICLFLILYLFVVLIYDNFHELLYIRVCAEGFSIPLLGTLKILISDDSGRNVVEWITIISKIGALLLLLLIIIRKIPGFTAQLASINGMDAKSSSTSYVGSTNNSAFALAHDMMGSLGKVAYDGVSKGLPLASAVGGSSARAVGRKLGAATGLDKYVDNMKSPMSLYRDHKIDQVIKETKAQGIKDGKSGPELDQYVREKTIQKVNSPKKSSTMAGYAGISDQSTFTNYSRQATVNRLNKQLVEEPLKQFISQEIKNIKAEHTKKGGGSNIPLGETAMREALTAKVEGWAKKNSSVDTSKFLELLESGPIKTLIKEKGELTSSQAAKIFANDDEGKTRYLDHLEARQFERRLELNKRADTGQKGLQKSIDEKWAWGKSQLAGLSNKEVYNPKNARSQFLSALERTEGDNAKSLAYRATHKFKSNRLTKPISQAGEKTSDFTSQKVGEAKEWTVEKAVKAKDITSAGIKSITNQETREAAKGIYDTTSQKAGEAKKWTAEKAGKAKDGATFIAGNASSFAKGVAELSLQAASIATLGAISEKGVKKSLTKAKKNIKESIVNTKDVAKSELKSARSVPTTKILREGIEPLLEKYKFTEHEDSGGNKNIESYFTNGKLNKTYDKTEQGFIEVSVRGEKKLFEIPQGELSKKTLKDLYLINNNHIGNKEKSISEEISTLQRFLERGSNSSEITDYEKERNELYKKYHSPDKPFSATQQKQYLQEKEALRNKKQYYESRLKELQPKGEDHSVDDSRGRIITAKQRKVMIKGQFREFKKDDLNERKQELEESKKQDTVDNDKINKELKNIEKHLKYVDFDEQKIQEEKGKLETQRNLLFDTAQDFNEPDTIAESKTIQQDLDFLNALSEDSKKFLEESQNEMEEMKEKDKAMSQEEKDNEAQISKDELEENIAKLREEKSKESKKLLIEALEALEKINTLEAQNNQITYSVSKALSKKIAVQQKQQSTQNELQKLKTQEQQIKSEIADLQRRNDGSDYQKIEALKIELGQVRGSIDSAKTRLMNCKRQNSQISQIYEALQQDEDFR